MTDRQIIFNAPMVRALLEGRKTQTRRAIPEKVLDAYSEYDDWCGNVSAGAPCSRQWEQEFFAERSRIRVGDRLYVREAWAPLDALTHNDPGTQALSDNGFYRADNSTVDGEITRWRPSIHMPRWASRLTLIVTDVRVQRVQEISDADGFSEGIDRGCLESIHGPGGFRDLWTSLYGPDAWAANPWVVALTFRVIRANIDSPEAANA